MAPCVRRSFALPATVNESFLSGTGGEETFSQVIMIMLKKFLTGIYLEELYELWKADPNSVHKSWQGQFLINKFKATWSVFFTFYGCCTTVFFKNLEANAAPGTANILPPTLRWVFSSAY